MLKRFCIVFCVILIVSFSVVPAFALSEGNGDREKVYYSTFEIDSVQNSVGDVFPWPNNSASFINGADDSRGTFDYCNLGFYGSVRNHCTALGDSVGDLITDFTIYDGGTMGDSCELRFLSDFVLLSDNSRFELMVNEDDILLYSVVMEFNVVQLQKNETGVCVTSVATAVSDSVDANFYKVHPYVDLASVARYLVCKNLDVENDDTFLLTDVCITVRYSHLSESTPNFLVTASMQENGYSPSAGFHQLFIDNYVYFPKPIQDTKS